MIWLRNLRRHKLRNLLTLLGVAAGICLLVGSLAAGNALSGQIRGALQASSVDVSVQAKRATNPLASRIPLADYQRLRKMPGVRHASSVTVGFLMAPWNAYLLLVGISPGDVLARRFTVVDGRSLAPGHKELILGALAANELGYGIGSKILLAEGEMFTVAGVFSLGVGVLDGAAVVDVKDFRRLLGGGEDVSNVFLQLESTVDPYATIQTINQRFPNLHAVRGGDYVEQIRLFGLIDVFVWATAVIALVTCCLVVMNTLLMAVTERTKEIGILLAVGWSRSRITGMIVSEAVCVCLAGSVLGNALATLLLWVIGRNGALVLGWMPSAIAPATIVGSMGLAVLLGIVSSAYPAVVASRLVPAEALRYE